MVKEYSCNAGLIPGLGRSPGDRNGCLIRALEVTDRREMKLLS